MWERNRHALWNSTVSGTVMHTLVSGNPFLYILSRDPKWVTYMMCYSSRVSAKPQKQSLNTYTTD